MKRALIAATVVVAVLALAAALILPRVLSPETSRPRLEQVLADLTGRSVAIGPMRLHVFPVRGVTADGFTLGEDPAFGTEPFLRADRIDARIRLMPLLSSRLDVVSFDIDKPVARLRRDAKGRWNLVSLMERAGSKPTSPGGATSSGAGLAILIERFRLIDGTLDMSDASVVPGTTHHIEGREIQ